MKAECRESATFQLSCFMHGEYFEYIASLISHTLAITATLMIYSNFSHFNEFKSSFCCFGSPWHSSATEGNLVSEIKMKRCIYWKQGQVFWTLLETFQCVFQCFLLTFFTFVYKKCSASQDNHAMLKSCSESSQSLMFHFADWIVPLPDIHVNKHPSSNVTEYFQCLNHYTP